MKKLFMIGLAATAMLASCSNDETMEMAQQKAIGFSNAFVNNGTRSIEFHKRNFGRLRRVWFHTERSDFRG
jgi:uncharacterized lipoprotein YajG